jgi:hypothetical protein
MKKPKRIFKVVWGDAHALSEAWGKFEVKDHKPRKVVSVGFLLRHDDIGISLTQSYDSQANDDHGLFIPTSCIIDIEEFVT